MASPTPAAAPVRRAARPPRSWCDKGEGEAGGMKASSIEKVRVEYPAGERGRSTEGDGPAPSPAANLGRVRPPVKKVGRAPAVGGSETAAGDGLCAGVRLCLCEEEAGEAALLSRPRGGGDPDSFELRRAEEVIDVPAEALSLPAGVPGEPGVKPPHGPPRVGVVAGREAERAEHPRADPGGPREVKDEVVHPRFGERCHLERGGETKHSAHSPSGKDRRRIDLDQQVGGGEAVDDEPRAGGGVGAEVFGQDGVDRLAVVAVGDQGEELHHAREVAPRLLEELLDVLAGLPRLGGSVPRRGRAAVQAPPRLAGKVEGISGEDGLRVAAGGGGGRGKADLLVGHDFLLPVFGETRMSELRPGNVAVSPI